MIRHIHIGWSAYFYVRTKQFSNDTIESLFSELPKTVQNAGDCIIRDVRKDQDGRTYSAICFSYDRLPTFLSEEAELVDRVHGYMLIVEHEDLIAIHRSGLEITPTFKNEWLRQVGSSAVERAIAKADAKFESMRMRSMSISKQAVRMKTLEADDLENAMPMGSASRYVGQRYRVRRGSTRYTASPTTGRISQNSDRAGYIAAINWSVEVMAELTNGTGTVAQFIESFARPTDLSSLANTVNPTNLSINIPEIADRVFSDPPLIKLMAKVKPKEFRELTVEERYEFLKTIDQEFWIEGPRDNLQILDAPGGAKIGSLNWGKNRIGLSTFATNKTESIYVAKGDQNIDETQPTALKMYLDRENLYIVLFDDVSIAYLNGELFQDKAMHDGGALFLSHLIPENCLQTASSEKGNFRANQKKFSPNSVFGQLVNTISANDDIIICDDLGDEWADFIGVNTKSAPPMITFYHAKHGDLSLGASAFHISVSQAEKNLGRLASSPAAMIAKFAGWMARPYANDKKVTSIARLIRGGQRVDIEQKIEKLRNSPELVRRVSIVTSSLSKKDVEDAFTSIKNGGRPSAHFVQLYWLLSSFFSACAEVGAAGYVVCQP